MDDIWKAYLSSLIFTIALLSSLTGQAASLEYISPELTKALAAEFSSAGLGDKDQALLKDKKAWTCSMYGVRTRLQVQHGVKLYDWSQAVASGWKNSGAQPVVDYHVEGGALLGKSAKVEDRVRLTKEGKLLSQLSLATPPHTVLAYSVCNSL